jgi:hypothetical protein
MYDMANARAAEGHVDQLEAKAKSLRGWRDNAARPVYQELLTVRHDNTEALFDLAQIDSSQMHTLQPISTYSELLQASPRHREAGIAIDRASMELAPQVHFRGDTFWQQGRDRLASVWRYRGTTMLHVPLRDENEFAQVHYARLRYDPTVGNETNGNLLGVRGQWKFVERLLSYGQFDLESYDENGFDFIVCWLPTQLKIVNQADYMTYQKRTMNYDIQNERSLLQATHPYFSPAGFAYYETRIEWLH